MATVKREMRDEKRKTTEKYTQIGEIQTKEKRVTTTREATGTTHDQNTLPSPKTSQK